VQWVLIGGGALMLAVWAGARFHSTWNSSRDVAAFEAARQARSAEVTSGSATASVLPAPPAGTAVTAPERSPALPEPTHPDTSDWAQTRIEHYQASLTQPTGLPEALLRIPTIELEVPVITGTDELTLNRAVGRIPGTAAVEAGGNLGIAGHRDGFFRGLKDVGPGDRIELVTLGGTRLYEISDIWIVNPDDVSVLAPTDEPSLTLVTCYPFYFVGHAPQRYIVRAVLAAQPGMSGPG
jgi:LPXTG-site transpeptidase (sortase) family protein